VRVREQQDPNGGRHPAIVVVTGFVR
jgi:hypothetical protein